MTHTTQTHWLGLLALTVVIALAAPLAAGKSGATLTNGATVANLSAGLGRAHYFSFHVPAGVFVRKRHQQKATRTDPHGEPLHEVLLFGARRVKERVIAHHRVERVRGEGLAHDVTVHEDGSGHVRPRQRHLSSRDVDPG